MSQLTASGSKQALSKTAELAASERLQHLRLRPVDLSHVKQKADLNSTPGAAQPFTSWENDLAS